MIDMIGNGIEYAGRNNQFVQEGTHVVKKDAKKSEWDFNWDT